MKLLTRTNTPDERSLGPDYSLMDLLKHLLILIPAAYFIGLLGTFFYVLRGLIL